MRGGWALDLETIDPVTGRKWDLSDVADQRRAKNMIYKHKPQLLTVSPPCTLFSALQNLSGGVKDEVALRKAVALVEFAVELCMIQHKAGRWFVFEHPASATSWRLPCLKQLTSERGMYEVVLHMCQFGMTQHDAQGEGLVKKPTRVYTNSEAIDGLLDRQCDGLHRHIQLMNGRAKAAAAYPTALSDAFIDGVKMEVQAKRDRQAGHLMLVADMCDEAESKEIEES